MVSGEEMLRNVFIPKKSEVTKNWRKLHIDEHQNF
jgi:hypothetical protein